jgi:serine/threonine protein kinase
MSLSPGTVFGQYRIGETLGAGGMGEVYRAHDPKLHRDVALKILADAFAGDPDRLARFGREAQMLASLSHPAIREGVQWSRRRSGPVVDAAGQSSDRLVA